MFGFLRRKKDKPLYHKLASRLRLDHGPMPRFQLVDLFKAEYGRKTVEREIDLLVDAELLVERHMLMSDGHGIFNLPCVGLPGQYERALGLTA